LDGSGDGVWFVDLAPLSDPGLVAAKTAGLLGVPEEPGRPIQESLAAALRSRKMLVVLDNCEHVIDEAATLVEAIAAGCPQVAILATSREPLRASGEHVYRVPSLSMPEDDDADALVASEAVRLFLERAAVQQPRVALADENAAIVGRLCRRLDGIPLAIELAAARLRTMSLEDLDRRLDRRLRVLTGGNRTALPRQKTLEALIDWSYDLLNPPEQDLLTRLSVFAGGFDLDAAEAVAAWGRGASMDVLDGLAALVDKSLVETDRSTAFRYRLLETVREYGAAKLANRGEGVVRAGRASHRGHYLALAEAAAPHLIGHGQLEWLDRLGLELDNLRAALAFCLEDPDPAPGLMLGSALCYFWSYREPGAEGATAICTALDRADARHHTPQRGRALVAAATLLAVAAGEFDAARERAQEALVIARELRDDHLCAQALVALASAEGERGNIDDHLALSGEALRAARAQADPHLTAEMLMSMGSSPRMSDTDSAGALEEALLLCRQTGNQVLYVRALCDLGYVEMSRGRAEAARIHLEEGVRLARDIGDRRALAFYTCNLAFAAYLAGAGTDARELFEESLRVARRSGQGLIPAYAYLGLALVASRAGDAQLAARLHGVADRTHDELGTHVYGIESTLRDADIARLRDVLGDDAWEVTYRLGLALGEDVGLIRA
jgi:predicted ATPase